MLCIPAGNGATETNTRNDKSFKRAEGVAKRKLMAQPEISLGFAEILLKGKEPCGNEHFVGQLALLHEYIGGVLLQSMWRCERWWAVEVSCDGSGESRRKARRKLERGLMPNARVPADAKRAF